MLAHVISFNSLGLVWMLVVNSPANSKTIRRPAKTASSGGRGVVGYKNEYGKTGLGQTGTVFSRMATRTYGSYGLKYPLRACCAMLKKVYLGSIIIPQRPPFRISAMIGEQPEGLRPDPEHFPRIQLQVRTNLRNHIA